MLSNTHMARCFLWRQNNPEVNYSPTRISGGECFQRRHHAAGTYTHTYTKTCSLIVMNFVISSSRQLIYLTVRPIAISVANSIYIFLHLSRLDTHKCVFVRCECYPTQCNILLTKTQSILAYLNPSYTKPSSSTLVTKLGSSEDPMFFFL